MLYFDIEIPVTTTEDVHRFQMLLLFEYKLKVS